MEFQTLDQYFKEEKNSCWILLALGLAGLSVSFMLWSSESQYVPMTAPFIVVSLAFMIIGSLNAAKLPNQANQLKSDLSDDFLPTLSSELLRMSVLEKNFSITKKIELSFALVSTLLVAFAGLESIWFSMGVGILIASSIAYLCDTFAHYRAMIYVSWLCEQTPTKWM